MCVSIVTVDCMSCGLGRWVLDCFLIYSKFICFFFFFQAEDGIRDVAVTGVQTCALPIYMGVEVKEISIAQLGYDMVGTTQVVSAKIAPVYEIGRASCRERV